MIKADLAPAIYCCYFAVKTEVDDPDYPPLLRPHLTDDTKSLNQGSTDLKPNVTKTALSNLLLSKTNSVTPQDNSKVSQLAIRQSSIPPDQWNVSDVCYFLKVHDCASYWESFVKSVSI